MQRGDFVRIVKGNKTVAYGVLLKTRQKVYDPPKDGLCVAVQGLVNTEEGDRKWYTMSRVFMDDRP